MLKTLYVFLNASKPLPPFNTLRVEGPPGDQSIKEKADFKRLRELAVSYELVAIIPAKLISHHQLALPNLNNARQVIPYALEEQLAADISDLHFAYTDRKEENGLYRVNVIDKAWLQALIGCFKDNDLELNRVISEQGYHPASALCHEATLYLSIDDFEGPLDTALFSQVVDKLKQAIKVHVFNDTAPSLKTLCMDNEHCQLKHHDNTYREHFVVNEEASDSINFCQAEFAPLKKYSSHSRLMVYALIGLACAAALAFISQFSHYLLRKQHYLKLKQQNSALYYEFFPKANTVVSPKFRITQLLKQQGSHRINSTLFTLLTQISAAFSKETASKIVSLRFNEDQMIINLTSENFKTLSQLKKQLEHLAVTVKQRSASTKLNAVEAIWKLRL